MGVIIGYKIFTTESEFVKWQETENKTVLSVSPLVFGFDGGVGPCSGEFDAKTTYGVFVTYNIN